MHQAPSAHWLAMSRPRRLGVVAAVLAVGAASALAFSLPPRAAVVSGEWHPRAGTTRVRGVMHVHTQRSDGGGTVDDVANAAARAGLDFVVITDHADGSRPLMSPSYRAGVLCIDAMEVSTRGGHVIALGLGPLPYRLAGEARDVVEDIHRFGGRAYATHPDSPRRELAWRDWDVPIDGFEWLNADTEWRDETTARLVLTLAKYAVRPSESLASLFSASRVTERWDAASRQGRRLVALAGVDAHARLGWQDQEDPDTDSAWYIGVPSYQEVFRTVSIAVELGAPLTGHAQGDAAHVIAGIDAGRVYSTVEGFARGGALDFYGETTSGVVGMGQRVGRGQLQRLVASVRAPARTIVSLLRNGEVVAQTSGLSLEYDPRPPAAAPQSSSMISYRIEARMPAAGPDSAPWLLSNPIWEADDATSTGPSIQNGVVALASATARRQWVTEHDARSTAEVRHEEGGALAFRFSLAQGTGPRWSAAVTPLAPTDLESLRRPDAAIVLELRASRPLRTSIQLRSPSLPTQDLRWSRSVFVGPDAQQVVVPVRALRPVSASAASATLREGGTLLIVIDEENTLPGTSGVLWVNRMGFSPGPS